MEEKTKEQRIRERAYIYYRIRARNGIPGTPEGDWVQAEKEMELLEPANRLNKYWKEEEE
jgi:hypothetical protein